MSWRIRTDCRLCGHDPLDVVLTLSATPPANELVRDNDPPQDAIPLYLAQCSACGHVQLPVVVDPERLFRNYVYVSGTSPSFVRHFHDYARSVSRELRIQYRDLVVEIGSNDGTLLRAFSGHGNRVLGIDPARAIAERATNDGIPTWPRFFDRKVAREILDRKFGHAALVVANNVFAHADDLREIALGVKDLLVPGRGRFVFEVQYLRDLVEKTLFDMVYHEHLSYHTIAPLQGFFERIGMSLIDVERVATHGGSVRCTVSPEPKLPCSPRMHDLLIEEAVFLAPLGGDRTVFDRLAHQIETARAALFETLIHLPTTDRVVGFGAPAKLTTLMHQFGLGPEDIDYVVDDSPWKQGLLTPGTRIPIVPASRLTEDPPDRVVIFAWNFADQIAAKHPDLKGRFIVPLPTYREL